MGTPEGCVGPRADTQTVLPPHLHHDGKPTVLVSSPKLTLGMVAQKAPDFKTLVGIRLRFPTPRAWLWEVAVPGLFSRMLTNI